jgi:hypothetical protein
MAEPGLDEERDVLPAGAEGGGLTGKTLRR